MTITDEELYRLADKYPMSPRDVRLLREAVLQRFKPREPRVIEGWGVVDPYKKFYIIDCKNEDEAKQWFATIWLGHPESYLAKAVITEVMEEA